ncbi:hypothetical protein [Aliidiomarina celeris]|uniref:hypothetical protein n=1 Tax=Aliidiomarina celeris TaxID=2249428 RepID=UPI0013003966|nr:hypothetical protein [Aliidiomarina celeris]
MSRRMLFGHARRRPKWSTASGLGSSARKNNWCCDIEHEGLGLSRRVLGVTKDEVNEKAAKILAEWDAKWRRQQDRIAKQNVKYTTEIAAIDEYARLNQLANTTKYFYFELYKSKRDSNGFKFDPISMLVSPLKPPALPVMPRPLILPSQPQPEHFSRALSSLARHIKLLANRQRQREQNEYHQAMARWKAEIRSRTQSNQAAEIRYEQEMSEWYRIDQEIKVQNKKIKEIIEGYQNGEAVNVLDYMKKVYETIPQPEAYIDEFSFVSRLELNGDTLLVNIALSELRDMLFVKDVGYDPKTYQLKYKHQSISDKTTALQRFANHYSRFVAHYLFAADTHRMIKSITFTSTCKNNMKTEPLYEQTFAKEREVRTRKTEYRTNIKENR